MEINITIKLDEEATNGHNEPVDRELYSVSPYARWFNETCLGWTNNPETNKYYLLQQQHYANELLKMRGYLFLNEVYDILGIPRTKAGQVVGWIFKEGNFVDIGLFKTYNKNFVNGYEKSTLLDFNVDGIILDRI